MDILKRQRELRRANGNAYTKKYEKTKKGFLMRLYRNMQSRITGVQKRNHNLYAGKYLLPRLDFYLWADSNPDFHRLFHEWVLSGYERRLAPSVDRILPNLGYEIPNMEFVTHSENSRRGALNGGKPVIQIDKNGTHIKVWNSLTDASRSLGRENPGNIVYACTGRIKTAYGFKWQYANKKIFNGRVV